DPEHQHVAVSGQHAADAARGSGESADDATIRHEGADASSNVAGEPDSDFVSGQDTAGAGSGRGQYLSMVRRYLQGSGELLRAVCGGPGTVLQDLLRHSSA